MPVSRCIAVSLGAVSIIAALLAAPAHAADGERVVTPQASSPELVVVEALRAASNPDEAAAFDAYLALVHPSRRGNADQIDQLRRYSWKRFRKQAVDYVLPETEGGFLLTRRDPKTITDTTTHVRLFLAPLNNTRRTYPTPIRLQRHEGSWRITANSL